MGLESRRAWGLLVHRAAWRLSARGWTVLLVAFLILALVLVRGAYPFLAITARVPSSTLVVDGWLPTHNLVEAAAEFRAGGYQRLLVPRAFYEYNLIDGDPGNALMIRQVLQHAGVPADSLVTLPFPGQKKDRTVASALAVRGWFASQRLPLESLDLYTEGAHARRSRLIWSRTLGKLVRVGVIAAEDPAFPKEHWWDYSDGIREVPFECLAYVRALFIVNPKP